MIEEQLIDQLKQHISQLEQLNNQLLYTPYFIIDISSATILICLYIWLRGREVKDPSLVWLYSSLLSWAIPKIPVVLGLKWPEYIFTIPKDEVKYVFSIISSVLFTLTAFKLTRVRDQKNIQRWRVPAIITVVLLSLIAWVLLFLMPSHSKLPLIIDAVASSIASGVLGYCFAYSFRKYDQVLLARLAWLTFGIFIVRQFCIAIWGTPMSGPWVFIFFWNTTMITMLFITLAVAWALSDVSRLKTAKITEVENIVALFFDLRGSTRWANEVAKIDLNFVKAFIDELREQAESRASKTPLGGPHVAKFLGDGFMYIWKVKNNSVADSFSTIVKLADDLNSEYHTWRQDGRFKRMETPDGIGFGIDTGPGSRFTFENGSDDYLGEPLNIAAKLQDRARPHGGIVIQEKLYNLLEDDIASKFTKKGMMRLGDREIAVRMTEEVEP
jgi:class 3 adenylate cyclase